MSLDRSFVVEPKLAEPPLTRSRIPENSPPVHWRARFYASTVGRGDALIHYKNVALRKRHLIATQPTRRYFPEFSSFPALNSPTIPRRLSHAASFRDDSELTRSRIISQATILRAPSGGSPIASDTAHCGQKQTRCAADFCLGLTPTVWANMYTATDLSPISIPRLQRRQTIPCKCPPLN